MRDHCGNDLAKAKTRAVVEERLGAALPKNRASATALYFGGTNPKESEMLDRCGIPRENRIILEYRDDRLWKTKHENKGVRIIPTSSHEFLTQGYRDYPQYFPLSFCGLDYEYKFNEKIIADLENITQHQLIADGGIFYTNIVGTHEGDDLKKAYAQYLFRRGRNSHLFRAHFSDLFNRAVEIVDNRVSREGLLESAIEKMLETLPSEKLNLLRNLAVVSSIQEALVISPTYLVFFETYFPGARRVFQALPELSDEQPPHANQPHLTKTENSISLEFDSLPLTILFENMQRNSASIEKNEGLQRAAHILERDAVQYYRRGGLDILATLFILSKSRGYLPATMDSYSYVSNRNTLMLLDIMQVRKARFALNDALSRIDEQGLRVLYGPDKPYLAKTNVRVGDSSDSPRILMRRLSEETKKNVHWIEGIAPFLDHLNPYTVSRHQYQRRSIASAYRSPLTDDRARECVSKGMTNNEIEKNFLVSKQGWRTVAALRANKTTGRLRQADYRK